MSKKYSLLLLLLPLILSSCWKRNPGPSYPISGVQWQEVKLHIYHKTYHGLIFNDTTYTRSAFDFLDYVQFFNDGTLKINSNIYYPLDASGELSVPPIQNGNGYSTGNFVLWRSLYLIDPSPFHADTVYYNGKDSLRIHSFQNTGLFYNEADAYYTRNIY